MSYIKTTKTDMTRRDIIVGVLQKEGLEIREGNITQGIGNNSCEFHTVENGYQVGFRLVDGKYELVYDQDYDIPLVERLNQLYASEQVRIQIEENPSVFNVLNTETLADGTIRYVVNVDETQLVSV